MLSVNLVPCAVAKTCEHASAVCDYMSKSPILFLVAIDWSPTNTTADIPRGIQWTLFDQLEDLDFADKLALISTNQYNMQEFILEISVLARGRLMLKMKI